MESGHNFRLQSGASWRCKALLWATILCVTSAVMGAGPDPLVCTPDTTPSPPTGSPRPQLPDQWKMRVEANILNKNYSTEVHEWYDGANNRGAVTQWDGGLELHAVYSYNTNQILSTIVVPDGYDECTASDLTSDPNNFLFGVKHAGNISHIYSTAGVLRFGGNLTETYMGKSDVRGIHTDSWKSCVYWPSLNATMTVEWHFSDKDYWDAAIGIPQIPVRCNVTGKRRMADGSSYDFQHLYEMTEFRLDISEDAREFETPAGTVCEGRKNTKPLPVPADAFSFSAEIFDGVSNDITYITERYDGLTKLVNYQTTQSSPDGSSVLRVSVVDDFGTGVSYTTLVDYGNCTAAPIYHSGFDVVTGKNNALVTMRSAFEFFFSDNATYTYEGVRTFNNVPCDVWVARRRDWPPSSSLNSTWEWYFATVNWTADNGDVTERQMPLGLILTSESVSLRETYAIFDYDEDESDIWKFDIGACFKDIHRQQVQLLIDGSWQNYVLNHQKTFEYVTVLSISNAAQVSPIRVNDLKMDYNGKYVLLTFTLLDKPPVTGDVANPLVEKSLTDAVTSLDDLIVNNTFKLGPFFMDMSQVPVYIPTQFYSDAKWGFATVPSQMPLQNDLEPDLEDLRSDLMLDVQNKISCTSSGYSSGSMAGMAFGMLFLGFLVVLVLAMLIHRHRNAPFRPQRFEMRPTPNAA